VSRPLTSIVVPCHDNLRYTALCLDSIAAHTPEDHEVIVVDNGCTDATAEWAGARGATVVRSRTNLGFAGGVNLGLAVAAGDVAVVLNNDALATPGWLAGLRGALALGDGTGIAGPRSNWVSDDQILVPVPYGSAPSAALDAFAAARHRDHAGEGREVTRISGLCMAVARPVLDAIGGFDDRFEVGNMEDEDYALRARLAGFRLRVADDSFVHHFGHKTFDLVDDDYHALLEANAMRYAAKWDLPMHGDPRGVLPGRAFDPVKDRIPLPA
jgi:GT2 family glycosyltransferase